jgi:hypothetical protein
MTIERFDGSGTGINSFTLAPGEIRLLSTYQSAVWVGRDARRRCLSGFVAESEREKWAISIATDGDYVRKNARSFPVYVAPEFKDHDSTLLQRCLEVLETNAKRIEDVVPGAALKRIATTPIWLEYEPDKSYGGIYFTSEEWLAANDISLAKANSIQFTSSLGVMLGNALNPLLHELAHAYHHLVLTHGYRPILAAYERARASGRYNAVKYISGRSERAYAITSYLEFFAELSEAYFGTNDFYPFTRSDLKEFDPSSYRVISDAWEHPFKDVPTLPLGFEPLPRRIIK